MSPTPGKETSEENAGPKRRRTLERDKHGEIKRPWKQLVGSRYSQMIMHYLRGVPESK